VPCQSNDILAQIGYKVLRAGHIYCNSRRRQLDPSHHPAANPTSKRCLQFKQASTEAQVCQPASLADVPSGPRACVRKLRRPGAASRNVVYPWPVGCPPGPACWESSIQTDFLPSPVLPSESITPRHKLFTFCPYHLPALNTCRPDRALEKPYTKSKQNSS
jgi:hypothetical protein